jgi:hypothetical protein
LFFKPILWHFRFDPFGFTIFQFRERMKFCLIYFF